MHVCPATARQARYPKTRTKGELLICLYQEELEEHHRRRLPLCRPQVVEVVENKSTWECLLEVAQALDHWL